MMVVLSSPQGTPVVRGHTMDLIGIVCPAFLEVALTKLCRRQRFQDRVVPCALQQPPTGNW